MLEALGAAAANYARAQAARLAVKGGRKAWPLLLAGVVAVVLLLGLLVAAGSGDRAVMAGAVANARPASAAQCQPQGQQAVPVSSAVPAQWAGLIARASSAYAGALPAPYFAAQIWAESGFNPGARSPVGAAGFIQFMPGTWAAHGIDGDGDGRADILNPIDNAMSSAKYTAYLGGLIDSDPTLAGDPIDLRLAAYNAGFGNVKKYRGVPPFAETRGYITKIRRKALEYAGGSGDGSIVATTIQACQAVADVVATGGYAQPIKKGAYRLSSGFGPRRSPGGVGSTNHMGTDLAAPIGTPIYSVSSGTVVKVGAASGYGQAVYVDSGGTMYRYGHISAWHVKQGQAVQAGQLIADVGNEGRSTGPHLHLECRPNDVPTNCVPFLAQRGVVL